ncbi:MAG: hypothetical protein ACO3UU_13740 [Minisyncoccia bacterium]
MEELIVEGLTPQDFKLLVDILKSYKVSLNDNISYIDVLNLYKKLSEIVNCLAEE